MTKTTARRSQIIKELSDLSRGGWANARPEDYQRLERELGDLPPCLRIPKAERAAAWEANPPKPMPFIQTERREATPEYEAAKAEFDEQRRLKSLAKVARMKARFASKAIDYSKMRWDQRRGKFVEDLPMTKRNLNDDLNARAKAEQTGKRMIAEQDAKYRIAQSPRQQGKTEALRVMYGEDWSRVNKDTARTLAELNGVWDDKYVKLSGGLLVMTVTNRLKGLVKKGGTVRWQ